MTSPTPDEDITSKLERLAKLNFRFDHKSILMGTFDINSKDSVNELLMNFVSLLNSDGGHIIMGISNNPRSPVVGIEVSELQSFLKKIKSEICSNIDPSPPEETYSFKAIPVEGGNSLILFKVGHTPDALYAVRGENGSLLFLKRDNENIALDVASIKDEMSKKPYARSMYRYIDTRAQAVSDGRGVIPLIGSGKLMVNIVPKWPPLIKKLSIDDVSDSFKGLEWCAEWMPTLDGHLGYFGDYSYVHLTEEGYLEAVDTFKMLPNRKGKKNLDIVDFQKDIVRIISSYLDLFGDAADNNYFSISLLNMEGYEMKLKMPGKKKVFEKRILRLPVRELRNENFKDRDGIVRFVNSFLEIFWNSSGL